MARPIYLLSDFGLQDIYVGVMKSIMSQVSPKSPLIDLNHGVQPFCVISGGYQLIAALPYLPKDCVVLAVIDPGVGSKRRALAIELNTGPFLVGPDNGLFHLSVKRFGAKGMVNLDKSPFNLSDPSSTFHGRDIFAPNAAALAKTSRLSDVGVLERVSIVEELRLNKTLQGSQLTSTVLHADRFGNIISNLSEQDIGKAPIIECQGYKFQFCQTFAEVNPGDGCIYVGSSGFLELALNQASLAERLSLKAGDSLAISIVNH